jgi:hypothetical protein
MLDRISTSAGKPFNCPKGLHERQGRVHPDGPQAIPPSGSRKPRVLCAYMRDTGEQVYQRPCCTWIVCELAESPLYKQEHVQRSDWCRKERCRFFRGGERAWTLPL